MINTFRKFWPVILASFMPLILLYCCWLISPYFLEGKFTSTKLLALLILAFLIILIESLSFPLAILSIKKEKNYVIIRKSFSFWRDSFLISATAGVVWTIIAVIIIYVFNLDLTRIEVEMKLRMGPFFNFINIFTTCSIIYFISKLANRTFGFRIEKWGAVRLLLYFLIFSLIILYLKHIIIISHGWSMPFVVLLNVFEDCILLTIMQLALAYEGFKSIKNVTEKTKV
ncbi:MAG: hypothetical protein ACOX2O_00810 [Bdellovibrionota bacterium]|jgi:hypothetical protein